jgi:hypothetical protein
VTVAHNPPLPTSFFSFTPNTLFFFNPGQPAGKGRKKKKKKKTLVLTRGSPAKKGEKKKAPFPPWAARRKRAKKKKKKPAPFPPQKMRVAGYAAELPSVLPRNVIGPHRRTQQVTLYIR